jgi:hypothetical protein
VNTTLVKVISGIMAMFILSYVGYQVYQHIYSPYKTETVFENVASDSVDAKGIMFRDEKIIKKTKDGVIKYSYLNGSKVAKSSAVAVVYEKTQDVTNQYLIKQIEKELNILNESQNQAISVTGQTEAITKQINDKYLQLVTQIESGALQDFEDTTFSMLNSLNKKQLAIGKVKNFSKRINQLKAQKKLLEEEISSEPVAIKTPVAGFFVDGTDGFEGVTTIKAVNSLTMEDFNRMYKIHTLKDDQALGKIITSYEWKFAVAVDNKDLVKFKKGYNVGLTFSSISDKEIDVMVDSINTEKDVDMSTVVLKSDLMSDELSTIRTDNVKINFKNNRGLKIQKEALRIVNGKKGVYRAFGGEMQFKQVDVVFETEDFILSALHPEDSAYVQLYDDVIIKGKDLYDKKPIK